MALFGVSGAVYGCSMVIWTVILGYIADWYGLQILFDLSFLMHGTAGLLSLGSVSQ